MGMLGNLVFGAVLAAILLGPPAWADAGKLLGAGLSKAETVLAGGDRSALDRTVAAARSALAHRRSAARLRP